MVLYIYVWYGEIVCCKYEVPRTDEDRRDSVHCACVVEHFTSLSITLPTIFCISLPYQNTHYYLRFPNDDWKHYCDATMSFRIIYSDGGETGQEHFWKFYTAALMPFTLGVPPSEVKLFLNAAFVGLPDTLRAVVEHIPSNPDLQLMPRGYREYFWSVYENAVSINEYLDTHARYDRTIVKLPVNMRHDFLYVTGSGFNHFENGGQLRFTNTPLSFNDFGSPPDLLTILDICASPQAVAVFSGKYPMSEPSKFRWKKVFNDPEGLIPVVCDKSNSTWAFRVGYEGQPLDDSDRSHFAQMTVPYGDSVACCLLVAIKSFVEDNFEGMSLDERFAANYRKLRTGFLSKGTNSPKPYSNLRRLQTMIAEKKLTVNMAAFDCHLFCHPERWFLTEERAIVLAETDDLLAENLISFVLQEVKRWHEGNPDSMREKDGAREDWNKLIKTLGPFGQKLKSVELSRGDDNKISEDEDGILFELWALACPVLGDIVEHVQRWISTGSPSPHSNNNSD